MTELWEIYAAPLAAAAGLVACLLAACAYSVLATPRSIFEDSRHYVEVKSFRLAAPRRGNGIFVRKNHL